MTGLLDLQFSADEISEIQKIFSKNDTKCLKNGGYSMLILIRDVRTDKAILGRLYLGSSFVCYTCENSEKAIPTGLYTVQNSVSPKFKRELPLIFNNAVPAKLGVRIHRGNSYKDSSACLLVGMGRDTKKGTISESAAAETMVTMLCRNVKKLIIIDAMV